MVSSGLQVPRPLRGGWFAGNVGHYKSIKGFFPQENMETVHAEW